MTIKNHKTGEERFKARFFVGGPKDSEKLFQILKSYTMKQSSIGTIMALATILGFDVSNYDLVQSYAQAMKRLKRDVFVRQNIIQLNRGELLQILMPIYGMMESGDYLCESFSNFHIHDLRKEQSTGDCALFFRREADKLVALSGTYVDDCLQAIDKSVKDEIQNQLERKFDVRLDDKTEFIFTGLLCDVSNKKLRTLSQMHYIKRINYLPESATWSQFRSLRAKLMWITHTHPDIACASSFAAQIVENNFDKNGIKIINGVVIKLITSAYITLQYHKLDQYSLKIVCYVDASFNNRENGKSQIGFIIGLSDASTLEKFQYFTIRQKNALE